MHFIDEYSESDDYRELMVEVLASDATIWDLTLNKMGKLFLEF